MKKIIKWIKSLFKKKDVDAPTTPSTPKEEQKPISTTPQDGPQDIGLKGVLYTEGNKIMRDGKPFILRGINIPDPSYNDIKDWELDGKGTKFHVDNVLKHFPETNVIRLPVLPGKKGGKEGWLGLGAVTYFNKHLLPAIEYINSKGVYVICDWHYLRDWNGTEDETKDFWKFIAPALSSNKMVIFELYNEPVDPRDWNSLRTKIMQPCIDIIRKHSDNLIIVGSPGWSSNLEIIDTLCTGTNLTYCYHAYSNQWPDKVKQRINGFMTRFNVPLFASELGWETNGTEGGTTEGYGRPYLDYLESNKISWTAWSHSKMWGPRLINEKSESWELSESGKVVAEYIRAPKG